VGTVVSTAIAPPSQSAGLRNRSRGPNTSTATIATAQNATTRNFTWIATAVTTPAAISRPSCRVRTQRTSSQVKAVHSAGSNVEVASRCPVPRKFGDSANAPAAISCARLPPPNSRASSAVSTIPATVASVAGMRSTGSDPGAIVSIASAISGSIGGWSA